MKDDPDWGGSEPAVGVPMNILWIKWLIIKYQQITCHKLVNETDQSLGTVHTPSFTNTCVFRRWVHIGYWVSSHISDPNPSGLKPSHSTKTYCPLLRSYMLHDQSKPYVFILLNLSSVLDAVNHKTCLSIFPSFGICGTEWQSFTSYLEGQSHKVRGGDSHLLHADSPPPLVLKLSTWSLPVLYLYSISW